MCVYYFNERGAKARNLTVAGGRRQGRSLALGLEDFRVLETTYVHVGKNGASILRRGKERRPDG